MIELSRILSSVELTIVRRIASGGMGSVYQATQHGVEGFGKSVAVKTILDDYSNDESFVRMFIGEAKLVADLVHQNIAQVYQLGRTEGLLYIVMEFVDGVNLYEFITRHREMNCRIPIDMAAYIASRICRGLEYAHKKTDLAGNPLGVVHQDISPNNVMVTHLGEIKILDFGVAKAANLMGHKKKNRLVGKFSYMSPEMAARQPTDNRADLYSLGVVLWEMLSGRRPLEGLSGPKEWLNAVRNAEIAPIGTVVNDLPPMLEKIVSKALQKDPDERYADAATMSYDLEYFMYHKGYGPTIVTMEEYLREALPDTGRGPVTDNDKSTLTGTMLRDESQSES